MPSPPAGYVYAADEDTGSMKAAGTGVRVVVEGRRPPFIVVDSRIEEIIVARWPGKLWLVRVAEALTENDERKSGLVRPVDEAGYIRAIAVDVLSQIPTWKLFGDFGDAVCAVIEQATSLDPDRVHALMQNRDLSAGDAYSRAWNNWLGVKNNRVQTDDLTGTLCMSSRGPRSPINQGFSVIYRAVWNRAEVVVGDSGFVHEEGETYLEPTWSAAANCLLEAAMAFGAPSLSEEADRQIMSAAWQKVIGPPPDIDQCTG